jgi:hypothetical protein
MNEEQPRKGDEGIEPTVVPLHGPNVISTFDTPPHPDALRAQEAVMRKHLQDRKPRQDPPRE